jgi:hypothetical protein
MTDAWLAEVADDLWRRTGGPPPFPRNLEEAAADAGLPVLFVQIPGLTAEKAEAWIARRHGVFRFLCPARALRGCIVALRGEAAIFTDPEDTPEERRFTEAHELAHFLCDYERPRQDALAALGPVIRPVLDGDRFPTPVERMHAALAGVPLGAYTDLIGRDEMGGAGTARTLRAELRADHLALHLLAPQDAVFARLPGVPGETERNAFGRTVVGVLCREFGLPDWAAREYGRRLWAERSRPDSRGWLGL